MDESNFFLDTNDKICMVDFEDVGLLPQCFASFIISMYWGSNPFNNEIVKYLDWVFDGKGGCNVEHNGRYNSWYIYLY